MSRSKVLVISDDQEVIQKARNFAYSMGVNLEIYSIYQWQEKERKNAFDSSVQVLSPGESKNVIPFPGAQEKSAVQTINELESVAIENAIHQYKGNLTEAAKALGIGRATLYRKVKQYNIDTSLARRKRAA
ncbi:MAG: helix-turn-helix domain-containing protein [Bdellovibrionales bacterium]